MRGTPQQIIEKYNQLARDAQLSGDRVATENFQQHAEHYLRLLGVAQKEQDARREQQERENRERQQERDRERAKRQERESNAPDGDPSEAPQPDVMDRDDASDSGLVETPESQPAPKPKRQRKPRPPKPTEQAAAPAEAEAEAPKGDAPDAPEAAE